MTDHGGACAPASLIEYWNSTLASFPDLDAAVPGYVYVAERAVTNYRTLCEAFPFAEVLVSVKANPNLALLRHLQSADASFDVTSEREFLAVRSGGQSRVSVVGPAKSRSFLTRVILEGAEWVVLESERQLAIAAGILRSEESSDTCLMLRVNPAGPPPGANEVMGGRATQFGIDEEAAASLLDSDFGHLFEGLHFYLGSQILETQAVLANLQTIKRSVERLRPHVRSLSVLNLGGGFGLDHFDPTHRVDLAAVAEGATDLSRHLRTRGLEPSLQFEAGRAIYGDCGVLVTRIVDIKESRGARFVITDCGINAFARGAVRWGERHPVWIHGRPPVAPQDEDLCTVVGPTCLPGDVLATDVALSDPHPDDLLVVGYAGAYGYSMSMHDWGSLGPVTETVL